MRRQNEKHNLCVRLCFFDAKYEKKWDHTHARIAGRRECLMLIHYPWQSTPTRELRVSRPKRNSASTELAIHTHARIAGLADYKRKLQADWQSTPTRELRGQFVCNCEGCRGLRTCILFRIGFENGEKHRFSGDPAWKYTPSTLYRRRRDTLSAPRIVGLGHALSLYGVRR